MNSKKYIKITHTETLVNSHTHTQRTIHPGTTTKERGEGLSLVMVIDP